MATKNRIALRPMENTDNQNNQYQFAYTKLFKSMVQGASGNRIGHDRFEDNDTSLRQFHGYKRFL